MPRPFALYISTALREVEKRAMGVAGIDEDSLMRRAGQAAWRQRGGAGPEQRGVHILPICIVASACQISAGSTYSRITLMLQHVCAA